MNQVILIITICALVLVSNARLAANSYIFVISGRLSENKQSLEWRDEESKPVRFA